MRERSGASGSAGTTLTSPVAKPTAPSRWKNASRWKSKPPGTAAGCGGVSRALKRTPSPLSSVFWPRNVTRSRSGIRSMAGETSNTRTTMRPP